MRLRVSIGSAIALGLRKGEMDCLPTTCYVMLGDACRGACGFCAQARHALAGHRLSRVVWPDIGVDELLRAIEAAPPARVCVQTLDYGGMVGELASLASHISPLVPVSAAVNPRSAREMDSLKDAGVERLGIGLDAASERVFEEVKGSCVGGLYTWEQTLSSIRLAKEFFGSAMTHIIVGLGESDRDIVGTMCSLMQDGIGTSLFAATPIYGASMQLAPPPLSRYRAMQAARDMVVNDGRNMDDFTFHANGRIASLPEDWKSIGRSAFMTCGCPDCNRPYYNEKPGEEPFNYPCIPGDEDVMKAFNDINGYINSG